jgi:diguanylate cyclase (GGDEF)-like protein
MDVLDQQIPSNLLTDKIVMIGDTSSVDSDIFFTSLNYNNQQQPLFGVELHAMLASQIISAVLDGRPIIRVLPEWLELCSIVFSVYLSLLLTYVLPTYVQKLAGLAGIVVVVTGTGYVLLLYGWWLPIVPILLAILPASLAGVSLKVQRLDVLATRDELTKLANRRTFNEKLQAEWVKAVRSQQPLSVILCDIDYFKLYNDTYGHLEGDTCLRQVAQALVAAVHQPRALVARYGGEEFITLLPKTTGPEALAIAETMRVRLQQLRLPHQASRVSKFVSLSLGVASVVPTFETLPSELINNADLGLYEAKEQGRDRAVLRVTEDTDATEIMARLPPAVDHYLRRLLRQNWDCLEWTIATQAQLVLDPLTDLHGWIHTLYPQVPQANEIIAKLLTLVKAHQELGAQGVIHRHDLDESATEIFALLGLRLKRIEAGTKARILIIDDRPDNTYLLALALKRQGYQVERLHDSTIALEIVQQFRPDLVLLDLMMPGVDGYTVCQALKSETDYCDIPVIFISASDNVMDKVQGFRVGAVDYITKPFQFNEVLARVEHQLRIQNLLNRLETQNMRLQQELQDRRK